VSVWLAFGERFGDGPEVMEHHGIRILRDGDRLIAAGPTSSALMRGVGDVEIRSSPRTPWRELHAVFNIVWPFVLPHLGLWHVHSGAVRDPTGRGWILAGDANVGKSTSTLALVTAGWEYAADDAVYVERRGESLYAHGWAEPIRLTARSAAALRVSRVNHASRLKDSAVLRDELASRRVEGVVVHRVLFPRLGDATGLRPLPASAALARLVRSSAWVMAQPPLASEYLETLRALATLPSAELVLGPELLEQPASLSGYLERGVAA
jgi:hypothetical protein